MFDIQRSEVYDYLKITKLFQELINEIIENTGGDQTLFNLTDTADLCKNLLESGLYHVFKAVKKENSEIIGFISICESRSLYADGTFGIIQELYICKEYRSLGIGKKLILSAINFAKEKEWKRLEVCTPPLPEFDRTLGFYEKEGFEITGGRKMKRLIEGM
ncbi:GNAT family N-acetyltransferase [Bacillus sp. 03113]|uniref:GNAT family N-acetyltransferase n=1 Tax=Bacillus sp. 03113 TaxID=2578211 RepID=UPI001144F0E8|nr:GNAT family N-acetyltransferase [Bacillus sp. 03113]